MTVSQQMRWWGAALAVFVLVLWLLSEALFPFVLGAAIAYLTDPLADWLERHGFSRLTATVIITLVSLGVVAVGILLVVPMLIEQVRDLIAVVPVWIEQARTLLRDVVPELRTEGAVLSRAFADMRDGVQAWSLGLLRSAWAGGMALLGFLGVLLVTPVVAFYLLMDWDHLVTAIDDNLPRQHRAKILAIARDLDRVLAGFVRGQMTVCAILGTFYAIALMLVGLKFGLLIGLFAGLISFIPFVGSIVGGALSVGVALAQFWGEWVWIGAVFGIFAAGQAIEGNFLTPKLVGGKVGLHPVWLMFALSAFGVAFGFIGLLIAVPAAAAIGVIGRFMLEQYRAGPLYHGPARSARQEREP
ncbi:MAG TPA: AI-2E family transporter [Paracoccaceae bacterium]|nr:AI-2E family transporter [Paracoccaceae bacterium]